MKPVRVLDKHGDTFHAAGKNWGKRIVPALVKGVSVMWDEDKKRFELTWENRKVYIPESSCDCWELEEGAEIKLPINVHKTEDVAKRAEAQVSTPHGYVFEGPGKGKTGTGKK